MTLVGIVEWTNRDKNGRPIAAVRPLIELLQDDYRVVSAAEEFPTQGQVVWLNAQTASEGSLISFRAEPNNNEKYEFKIADPRPAHEILDLRRYGDAYEVRDALVAGVDLPGLPSGVRVLIWCEPDVLIGPVELVREDCKAILSGANLHFLHAYTSPRICQLTIDHPERPVRLLRVDDRPPTDCVDWDDDTLVIRRAIEAAVRVAKQSGHDAGLTKKQIEEAASALVAQGVGSNAQLDLYRLERTSRLLKDSESVAQVAAATLDTLLEHPSVQESLDEFMAKVRTDIERRATSDLEQRFAHERAALTETTETHARAKAELEATEQELRKAEEHLANVQSRIASAAMEAEAAVNERVRAVFDRPLELLAEVSVLRPFLEAGKHNIAMSTPAKQFRLNWSGMRGDAVRDKAALRRSLTGAARARGVDPSLMLHIHAAVAARLVPATLGPGALAALSAYAHGACGGRLLVVPVSPAAIELHDLDEVPGGGPAAAAMEAADIDGISLVVFEGVNRSPLEACVVPLLQMMQIGLSPLSSTDGLRLAASMVTGVTTVPVTPQLWSHAVAIYPDPMSPTEQAIKSGDITLTSELFALGDEPTAIVDSILDSWPDCRELRPTMCRFGSALSRFYEEDRITGVLLKSLVLPYVATALTNEDQVEALVKASDTDGTLKLDLNWLRRRLA